MHNLELVNSETHRKTKVSSEGVLASNANVHMSHIVLMEFVDIAQYYPIFFVKDNDTGQFQPVALFGLAVDRNTYQASGLWEKCYLPLKIQSQPFYLIKDNSTSKPCLAIDIKDNRVQEKQGEALFLNNIATPYLQQKAIALAELTKGFVLNNAFINDLLAHNLLESVELDIMYNNRRAHKLNGLYTINKDMLEKIPADIQKEFEQQDYVSLISAAISSVNHVSTMIDIENALIAK
jgi:hypothetical protein